MRYLYKGKTKIGKIHVKTKVNTDFITAGPEDIAAGKKSINSNYEEITGTMDMSTLLPDMTDDATATAADITSGKIGYVNGQRLVGTAPRDISTLLMTNSVIDTYTVGSNETINAGDFVAVNLEYDTTIYQKSGNAPSYKHSENASYYSNIVKLNNSKGLLIYSDGGLDRQGIIKIITVDGFNTSYSNQTIFNTTRTDNIHAIKMNDKHVLVSYLSTNGTTKKGQCVLLTFNDIYTNVTVSNPIDIYVDEKFLSKLVKLTDTRCVISYITTGKINSQIIDIDYITDTISTYTSSVIVNSNNADEISVATISDNKALLAYTTDNTGNVIEINISNNTISKGVNHLFSNDGNYINLIKMSDTKFLLLYTDQSLGGTYAQLLFFNRNSIKLLNAVKISDSYYNMISATYISKNTACILFIDNGNLGTMTCMKVITNPDNTISLSVPTPLYYKNSQYLNVISMTSTAIMISYVDMTNSPYYGYIQLLQFEGGQITSAFNGSVRTSKYIVRKTTTASPFFNGIANTTGTSGQTIEVISPPKS